MGPKSLKTRLADRGASGAPRALEGAVCADADEDDARISVVVPALLSWGCLPDIATSTLTADGMLGKLLDEAPQDLGSLACTGCSDAAACTRSNSPSEVSCGGGPLLV